MRSELLRIPAAFHGAYFRSAYLGGILTVHELWPTGGESQEKLVRQAGVSPPAEFAVAADEHVANHRHHGQLRMAQRFVREHRGRLLHVHGLGWHAWDGARWAQCKDGAPSRAAVVTIQTALRSLAELEKEERGALYQDILKVETAAGVKGMLELAGSMRPMAIAAERMNADPYLFNCANGTLDLRSGELRAHRPTDMISKVAAAGLDLEASHEELQRFLDRVLPSIDVRRFCQRIFGMAMLGVVREHVLPIFCGDGANGKSVLMGTMRAAFGDYAIEAEPDLLVVRQDAHPTGQADLLGVRLVTTVEVDKGRAFAPSTVKKLTGGDRIRARRMRQDFFEFEPSHTIVMGTNYRPKVDGDDPAMARRLQVVPFEVVIPEAERDAKLPERLLLELPAALAWAFVGYQRYQTEGLAAPERVTEETESYLHESSPWKRFLEVGRVEAIPGAKIQPQALYQAWAQWCEQVGEDAGSEVDFSRLVVRNGFPKSRSNGRRWYIGLSFPDQARQEAL